MKRTFKKLIAAVLVLALLSTGSSVYAEELLLTNQNLLTGTLLVSAADVQNLADNDYLSGGYYTTDNDYLSGGYYNTDYDVISGDYCSFLENANYSDDFADDRQDLIEDWTEKINNGFDDAADYDSNIKVIESASKPIEDESWKNDRPSVDIVPQVITNNEINKTIIKPETAITVPVNNTPTYVKYYMGVEVGRLAHIDPIKDIHTTLSSSDTSILSIPYRREEGDYPSRAYKPGKAVLTFYNAKDNHTEEWEVNVYTRPLDFEKTEYVAEITGDYTYSYINLQLKNFEHSFEPSYEFKWESSDKSVAEIYGGDPYSTSVRLRLKKAGATIVTVSDKFGNKSSAALVVRYSDEYYLNKASFTAKLKAKKGYINVSFKEASDISLDGYEIYVSGNKGKTYSKKKTIKAGSTLSYKYKGGKKGKVYYFKVRGYKLVDGKKVYTDWSSPVNAKFKK